MEGVLAKIRFREVKLTLGGCTLLLAQDGSWTRTDQLQARLEREKLALA
jgi:hypothetical protein